MKNKNKILELLSFYKLGYLMIILLVLLDCIVTYLYPEYLSTIIDVVIPEKNSRMFLSYICLLAGFQMVSIIVSLLLSYMFTRISNSIIIRIKREIIQSVSKLNGQDIKDKARVIMTAMNDDIRNIEMLSSRIMAQLLIQVTTVMITGVVLIKINKIIFYVIVVVYPILIYVQVYFNKKLQRKSEILMARIDIGYSLIKEFVNYVYEYIALNAIDYFMLRFMNNEKNVRRGQLKYNMLISLNTFVPQVINMGVYLFIVLISGYMVMDGNMLSGEFLVIVLYTQRMFNPIAFIMSALGQMQRTKVSVKRINKILLGCDEV